MIRSAVAQLLMILSVLVMQIVPAVKAEASMVVQEPMNVSNQKQPPRSENHTLVRPERGGLWEQQEVDHPGVIGCDASSPGGVQEPCRNGGTL